VNILLCIRFQQRRGGDSGLCVYFFGVNFFKDMVTNWLVIFIFCQTSSLSFARLLQRYEGELLFVFILCQKNQDTVTNWLFIFIFWQTSSKTWWRVSSLSFSHAQFLLKTVRSWLVVFIFCRLFLIINICKAWNLVGSLHRSVL
jgi:hypothetical protein